MIDFMDLNLHLWLISKTFKKKKNNNKNKEEKYVPVIVWMVGLIKTFNMDFTNIKLPN